MAGTPADLTVYIDTDPSHDHTYFGRGCPGGDGSITPCIDSAAGGRYVATVDGETQKNGTYYHIQAVTVGTGAAMKTDNANAPDTFCPLGWQMPYSGKGGDYYDKSKSNDYLFTAYNIDFDPGSTAGAIKLASYPFSYVYSGNYYWGTGRLYRQSNVGYYWSPTVVNSTSAYALTTWSSFIRPADTANKVGGYAIRYV